MSTKTDASGWGGARAGAGRPPGSRSRTDAEKSADAAGVKPLEYMLAVMNDPAADAARRDAMAIAAAPYVHQLARRDPPPRSPSDPFLPPVLRGKL